MIIRMMIKRIILIFSNNLDSNQKIIRNTNITIKLMIKPMDKTDLFVDLLLMVFLDVLIGEM